MVVEEEEEEEKIECTMKVWEKEVEEVEEYLYLHYLTEIEKPLVGEGGNQESHILQVSMNLKVNYVSLPRQRICQIQEEEVGLGLS